MDEPTNPVAPVEEVTTTPDDRPEGIPANAIPLPYGGWRIDH